MDYGPVHAHDAAGDVLTALEQGRDVIVGPFSVTPLRPTNPCVVWLALEPDLHDRNDATAHATAVAQRQDCAGTGKKRTSGRWQTRVSARMTPRCEVKSLVVVPNLTSRRERAVPVRVPAVLRSG